MLMNKNKHWSDESRSEKTSHKDNNISEQLEIYENIVIEAISSTDSERKNYRLMNKNKPRGEEIQIETVRTYIKNLKVVRGVKVRKNKEMNQ